MTIADIIRNARRRRGITLRALAAETGLSNPVISQIENGQIVNPGIITVMRIARALGVRPATLAAAAIRDHETTTTGD
jgi:transcriptional regulator with XRE-family HTH domain